MSKVRVLVGTRKGAFVLTSDGKREKWEVSGPFFGGWEIYHLKGSPVDPNRLYASQSSGWFGQQIQRSNDGGVTFAAPVKISQSHQDFEQALAMDNSGNVNFTWAVDGPPQLNFSRLPTVCHVP